MHQLIPLTCLSQATGTTGQVVFIRPPQRPQRSTGGFHLPTHRTGSIIVSSTEDDAGEMAEKRYPALGGNIYAAGRPLGPCFAGRRHHVCPETSPPQAGPVLPHRQGLPTRTLPRPWFECRHAAGITSRSGSSASDFPTVLFPRGSWCRSQHRPFSSGGLQATGDPAVRSRKSAGVMPWTPVRTRSR